MNLNIYSLNWFLPCINNQGLGWEIVAPMQKPKHQSALPQVDRNVVTWTLEFLSKAFSLRFWFQWIVALSAASGAISIGTCYGLSSVLIPALQEETNPLLWITLEEGSIIGKNASLKGLFWPSSWNIKRLTFSAVRWFWKA